MLAALVALAYVAFRYIDLEIPKTLQLLGLVADVFGVIIIARLVIVKKGKWFIPRRDLSIETSLPDSGAS